MLSIQCLKRLMVGLLFASLIIFKGAKVLAETSKDCQAELSNPSAGTAEKQLPIQFNSDGRLELTRSDERGWLTRFVFSLSRALFRPMNIDNIEQTVGRLLSDKRTDVPFWLRLSEAYGQKLEFDEAVFSTLPKTGPILITANHPLNGIEGIAIAAMISKVRPDVTVIMTPFLKVIPGIDENAIFMDPDGGREAVETNRAARLEAVARLNAGHCVVIFPAGEVSLKNKISDRTPVDSDWKPTVAKILRGAPEAQVLPIFVGGQSSSIFQLAKKIEAKLPKKAVGLRRAISVSMHIREIGSHFDKTIALEMGPLLSAEKLIALPNGDLVETLRAVTYEVAAVKGATGPMAQAFLAPVKVVRSLDPIADELPAIEIENELNHAVAQGRAEVIYDRAPTQPTKGLKVYFAKGRDIPTTLKEVGRLREITFRAVGEGSGRSRDNDIFDEDYDHLLVWEKSKNKIIGAYRMGRVDELMAKYESTRGVYSRTLFNNEEFLKVYGHQTIEMGRSFVLPEYQRNSLALPVLWRGIGQFLVKNPKYKFLIGPMSISGEYQERSKQVMVEYLQRYFMSAIAEKVFANEEPSFATALSQPDLTFLTSGDGDGARPPAMDALNDYIKAIEGEKHESPMGIPPLVAIYGKLGYEVLSISVDREFNSIDGLILVNLPRSNPVELEKYMGKDEAAAYLKANAL